MDQQRSPDDFFPLTAACNNCPFRKDTGPNFGLSRERLVEIYTAAAFQCHKTIDYSRELPMPGKAPIQCAGLIALQHKENTLNTITTMAVKLISYDPSVVQSDNVFDTFEECVKAHNPRET